MNKLVMPTLIAIAMLAILWFVASGETKFSVELFDAEENPIAQQFVSVPVSAQSLAGDFTIMMQSAAPVTEDTTSVFKATVDNPFDSNADVVLIEVFKNGRLEYEKQTVALMKEGESFTYKTDVIDLKGKEAQRNTIRIDFTIKDLEDNTRVETFEFNYYYLFQCHGDSDCETLNFLCDKGNSARFSTTPYDYFCVKTCGSHTDCFDGQICIKGFCGY